MAYRLKFTKCGSLSLSIVCILLGLLDLAANIYIITVISEVLKNTDSYGPKFLLIVAVIGILTCLFMMSGSILNTRWSMIPHIGWEMLLILIYAIAGVILLSNYVQGDRTIDIVKIVIILSCAPILSFLYWNVIYSRYLEIKEKQLVSSDSVPTQ